MPKYHAGRGDAVTTVEVQPGDYAAGNTNGIGVDMSGFDGVVFDAIIGGITGAGVYDMRVVESENANFSGAVNIANAAIVQVTNAAPNTIHSIDVFRATNNRYLRVVSSPATNNVEVTVIARRYRAQGRTPYELPTGSTYVEVSG